MEDNNKNKYEVSQVYIESASYNLLILKIPIGEIDDKLTHLSHERGLIAKSLYDDFLIATCIANINPFLQHLNQKGTNLVKLNEIRAEMIKKILQVNKDLVPSNLIINKNHVIKLKKGKIDEGAMLLTKNEFWNKDIYKEGEKDIIKTGKPPKKLDQSKIKNIKDLKYIPLQKFWKRIQQYITVKQFTEADVDVLLGGRSFDTRTAFEQYVVTICIEEVEDPFVRLDKLGLPQRIAPPILIHELYEICRASNLFLNFDMYRDSIDDGGEESVDPFASFHRKAEAGLEEDQLYGKKKTKLFRHIKKTSLLNLGDKIKHRVIGQDKAIDNLVDAIQRASVGLKDPEQPIGSFVFTGQSGCGKTYAAKILAEELINSPRGIVVVDCSEYSADHEYAKLIGAPMGYIGHEQGGYLTNAIRKQPFSVVLFDEIEKASEKVHQLLLQIMDEARLTDGKGHYVSFKDIILIMTSNLGVKEIHDVSKTIGFGNVSKLTPEKRFKAIKESLKKKFKPEFLNRITSIINFNNLTKENYLNIIKLELNKLKRNLKLSGTGYSNLELNFDKSLYEFIYEKGIDEKYGARPLKRAIEREISTPLARKLLKESTGEEELEIKMYYKANKLGIDMKKGGKISNPPFYLTKEAGK
jgi:ATP-dependent Clp protease ATP-binding subunit ClpC